MGDLVAVLRDGGLVEQYGTPAEILASPASDFVARFVGTDRGLKRLSLFRVNDVPLAAAVTARAGDDAAEARRRVLADPFRYLLLLDGEDRPIGWIDQHHVPASGVLDAAQVGTTSPLLDRRTTLKVALSMLLEDSVQAGVVVDRHGVFRGLVTVDQLGVFLREAREEAAG
jgi:osmoprotectant transport system ATP-binding protein